MSTKFPSFNESFRLRKAMQGMQVVWIYSFISLR